MTGPPPDPEAWTEAEREEEDLRATVRRLEARLRRADAKVADLLDAVYAAARDGMASAAAYRKAVPPPRQDARPTGEEVALWHLTDWQGGKKTASYDLSVLDERIGRFCAKAHQITAIQRADHPVKRCVVLLGGDMLEGSTIFPGQLYELAEVSVFSQVFRVADILTTAIRAALSIYESVAVVAEDGNHGRIGKRGDTDRGDNWDRVIYRVVSERFTDEPRVTWQMNRGRDWYQPFAVGAYRGVLMHGDEIRSFGGNLPAYGILRKANSWSAGVIPPFTDLYLGHFHTPMTLTLANGGRVFVTGSPESDNVYAHEFVAAAGVPSQRLHFVEPAAGRVTAEYTIWLS
jgi:hypothetical protein